MAFELRLSIDAVASAHEEKKCRRPAGRPLFPMKKKGYLHRWKTRISTGGKPASWSAATCHCSRLGLRARRLLLRLLHSIPCFFCHLLGASLDDCSVIRFAVAGRSLPDAERIRLLRAGRPSQFAAGRVKQRAASSLDAQNLARPSCSYRTTWARPRAVRPERAHARDGPFGGGCSRRSLGERTPALALVLAWVRCANTGLGRAARGVRGFMTGALLLRAPVRPGACRARSATGTRAAA